MDSFSGNATRMAVVTEAAEVEVAVAVEMAVGVNDPCQTNPHTLHLSEICPTE